MTSAPRVFTIAPERPFLETLARGLLSRYFDAHAPERFAELTVLLPTRRATRALAETLLSQAEQAGLTRALVLPTLRALGDVDEDSLILDEPTLGGEDVLDIPPALPSLRRRLLLAKLVSAFFERRADPVRRSAVEIARLAAALEAMLDQIATHGTHLDALKQLAPAAYAAHWQETLTFLSVLTDHWPEILAAEGAIETAERRTKVMEAYCKRLEARPSPLPIIAAGSTGTHPTTARLLAAIARLPEGAVVLPGLDQDLGAAAWAQVGPSHPQGAMKELLPKLGVARDDVLPWQETMHGHAARTRVLCEALRPWEATDAWRDVVPDLASALAEMPADGLGLTRIDVPHQGAEANAIALLLRNALEEPDATAALVTPDRRLARGVIAALKRWDIAIDDSAGLPLALTPPAVLLRLLARAADERLAPVALLSLLKHPLCTLGLSPQMARGAVRAFERACLRGLAPGPGFAGLEERIAGLTDETKRRRASAFLARLASTTSAFVSACASSTAQEFGALLSLHLAAAEAVAATDGASGVETLWSGLAGESASALLAEAIAEARDLPTAPARDYPAYFESLLDGVVVRPSHGQHPRLFIWGPLEARLQRADVVVLGGLNEGTWPREPAPDPWLSRAMGKELGLPPPEQRLGLSAHDFVAIAAQARHAYLTRAEKVDGAPTVASRWLVRLDALMEGLGRKALLAPARPWAAWADSLDRPDRPAMPEPPPEPRPDLALRPRTLSVTRIGRWIRDPYAIYAEYILGLKPLRPVDEPPGPRLRGIVVHDILQRFLQAGINPRDPSARAALLALAEDVFTRRSVPAPVRAFWWPRFVTLAGRFLDGESQRLNEGREVLGVEVEGRLAVHADAGAFILTARADRIDRLADGTLEILDYKTGGHHSASQIEKGLEPQLPLEAAIAAAGGFADITPGPIETLRILVMRGAARDADKEIVVGNAERLAAESLERLRNYVRKFDDPDTPYRASVMPLFRTGRFLGDYDHLARLAEWSAGEEDAEP